MTIGTTAGMTAERAAAWVAGLGTRWRRWVLVGAGVAAFVASAAGEPVDRCTPADPSVCGPDPVFSAAVVLAVAAVVLVWWRPVEAAACAVGFAVLDVRFDDVVAANVAWTLLALLHVGHVLLLRRERASRRRAVVDAFVDLPVEVRGSPRLLARDPGLPLGPSHLAVLALVAASLACLGVLAQQLASEAAHEERSSIVGAVVVGSEGEDGLAYRLRLEEAVAGVPREPVVETLDEYEVGERVPVRVDPADPGWTHLVAEPPDVTWWLSLAVGGLLLAVVLARPLVSGRMHRRALAATMHTSGVPVRWVEMHDDVVPVLATDREVVVAELEIVAGPRPAGPESPRLEQQVRSGWLVGDVREGGWVALAHPGGLELPAAPLRVLPDLPQIDDTSLDPELEEDLAVWSDPVSPDTPAAALPARLGPGILDRLVGTAGVLAGTLGGLWLLGAPEASWWQGIGVCLAAFSVVHWGVDRAVSAVRVDAEGIGLVDPWRRHRVPMTAVADVRVAGDDVVVLLGGDEDDEDGLVLGPWVRRVGPGRRPVPTAAAVAAAVDARRPVVRPPEGAGVAVTGAVSPGAPVLVLAVALLAIRWLAVLVL
mgnify:CR=1 FL=1